jgi:hypothetical protein
MGYIGRRLAGAGSKTGSLIHCANVRRARYGLRLDPIRNSDQRRLMFTSLAASNFPSNPMPWNGGMSG